MSETLPRLAVVTDPASAPEATDVSGSTTALLAVGGRGQPARVTPTRRARRADLVSVPAQVRGAAAPGLPKQPNDAVLVSILDELRELRAAVEASLAQPQPSGLVDAGTVAAVLGVSRAWVYDHADELGGVRLGDGAKPRLRFDLNAARERMACSASKPSQGDSSNDGGPHPAPTAQHPARLPNGVPKPGSILAVRPRDGIRSSATRVKANDQSALDSRRKSA